MSKILEHILIVPPFDNPTSCIVTGCKDALEKQGCQVDVFDTEAWLPVCSALQHLPVALKHQDALEAQGLDLISRAAKAVAESKGIDIVLGFPRSPLTASVRKELQAQSITTVCWMTEESASFPYWRKVIEGYDVVATIQHEPLISEISVLGHTSVYLPFAANGACCMPISTYTAAEDMIVVLGDVSDEIANALASHIGRGMVIWGDGWENYEQFMPYYQGKLQSLTRSDRKALYKDAAIIVNIHSTSIGSGDAVNMETYAIAACGGFQIVDKRTLMEGVFSYDELVMFESAEELSEQITEFIDDRDSRLEYARNAQNLVLSKHTYDQRMQSLLQAIAGSTE